ncbi:MAG: hypothetical protein KME67_03915 [Candidatus Thiodiazotropha sp. (ex Codakia orbicularis)]|nr:hypothetical protein [Candidatus Thiodiazotropha sp. (ex Codakia orbicularis)]
MSGVSPGALITGRKGLLPNGLTTVTTVGTITAVNDATTDNLSSGSSHTVFDITGPGELPYLLIKPQGAGDSPVVKLTVDGEEYQYTIPSGSTAYRVLAYAHTADANHMPSIKFGRSLKLVVDCTTCGTNVYAFHKYFDA